MQNQAAILIQTLTKQGLTLASCESFTGGLFANTLTNIPGASKVFLGGYVTYSPELKIQIGVSPRVLKKYGVVSSQTAEAMAKATLEQTKADFCVSFTGDAGPGVQPNGTVGVGYLAVCSAKKTSSYRLEAPDLDRVAFKKLAVNRAIHELLGQILK